MDVTRLLSIAMVVAILPPARPARTPGKHQSVAEQEIRSLQERLINAYTHRDLEAMKEILAEDYTFVESHGRVLDKADLVQNFGSGDRVLTSYVMDDDRVRIYGDAAVMTYHYRTRERYKGADQSGDFRMIRVFARRNAGWQMVAGQETAVVAASR